MRRHLDRTPTRLAGAALMIIFLALPAGVFAHTNEQIAATGGMTATFPLLGTPLTVGVTLDAVGDVSGVTLDPAGALTAGTPTDHAVKLTNADGTATVTVRAKGDKLSLKAKGTLAGLVGPGTWSAAVFGPGTDTSVDYVVGTDGSGHPTLTLGTVTPGTGVTYQVKAPGTDEDEADDAARVEVTFAYQGYVKRLTISVEADEEGNAVLKIDLTGKDRLKATGTLEELAGPRTWSAHLCDGTPVAVLYHVDPATSAVVYDSATGGTVSTQATGHGFLARFDGTKVRVKVDLLAVDGSWQLKANGKSDICGKHDKASGKTAKHGHGKSHGRTGRQDSHATSGDSGDDGDRAESDHEGDD
jgi:hypothetical protein